MKFQNKLLMNIAFTWEELNQLFKDLSTNTMQVRKIKVKLQTTWLECWESVTRMMLQEDLQELLYLDHQAPVDQHRHVLFQKDLVLFLFAPAL